MKKQNQTKKGKKSFAEVSIPSKSTLRTFWSGMTTLSQIGKHNSIPVINVSNRRPMDSIDFTRWSSVRGAAIAAAFEEEGKAARLVGHIRFMIKTSMPQDLWAAHSVCTMKIKLNGKAIYRNWDDDGEYPSVDCEHIPISRLMDRVYTKDAKLIGDVKGKKGYDLLRTIHALQAPASSPWKRPMIRLTSRFCKHPSDSKSKSSVGKEEKASDSVLKPLSNDSTNKSPPEVITIEDSPHKSGPKTPEIETPIKAIKIRIPSEKTLGLTLVNQGSDVVKVLKVSKAKKSSVGHRSGIRVGDVIVSIDKQAIHDVSDATAMLQKAAPDSVIEFLIQKASKRRAGSGSDKENIRSTNKRRKVGRQNDIMNGLRDEEGLSNLFSPASSSFVNKYGLGSLLSGVDSGPLLSEAELDSNDLPVTTKDTEDEQVVEVVYSVYFTRLLFELVADPAIHTIMQHIVPVVPITTPAKPSPTLKQPQTFTSKITNQMPEYQFTLPGVMKAAESKGYRIRDLVPEGIKTTLFEYQHSSFQWMLDHERDKVGLNGYFWEEREWADGGKFYYFPLAGELRLAKPPFTTGGLLCEEMGLGKTLEVLSLILANPRQRFQDPERICTANIPLSQWIKWNKNEGIQSYESRASLIVVPLSLIGQWYDEIAKHVETNKLEVLTISDLPLKVPISSITFHGGTPDIDNQRRHTRFFGEINLPLSTRPYKVSVNKVDFEDCTCEVKYLFENMWDWDIVLTTYDVVSAGSASGTFVRGRMNRVHWHRCILDECQEIKKPTAKIAKMCNGMKANHRWMVSGTPLHSSIFDLHGELNFLKVWPFSLQKDGFWERKVQMPFGRKDQNGLRLLHALIDITMIRHSKSQSYVDGRPLVQLPKRTVEYVGVDFGRGIVGDSDSYVYWSLEIMLTNEIKRIKSQAERSNLQINKKICQQMRAFFILLQRVATDPACVSLVRMDHLVRQMMGAGGNIFNVAVPNTDLLIPALSADEALRALQLRVVGRVGEMNRDSNRSWAIMTEEEKELRRRYEEDMSVGQLRDLLLAADLPIPKTWGKVKCTAQLNPQRDAVVISDHKHGICIGENIRISSPNEENEVTVKQVDEIKSSAVITFSPTWQGVIKKNGLEIFRWVNARRRTPYVDLLLAHHKNKHGIKGGGDIQEAGFATIYRLIAKTEVQCPICMCEVTKPTVTKCVHLFCQECLLLEISDKERQHVVPKCPICRRAVSKNNLMEIVVTESEAEEIEEADQEDDDIYEVKTARSSTECQKEVNNNKKMKSPSIHTKINLPDLSDFVQTATEEMLGTCTKPYYIPRVGLPSRDPHLPALEPTFLWNARHCQHGITSKVSALFDDMQETYQRDQTSKFIVFSQYPDVVKRLAELSLKLPWKHELICGGVTRESRQMAVSNFQQDPNCKVIFLTTGAAAAGLTLTAASTLYMMEPCASSLDEAQALSRAHRIGAHSSVRCVIFYMTGSVDERLLMLRQSQGSLIDLEEDSDALVEAQDITEEGKNKVTSGFSFNHLTALFGMERIVF